MSVSCQRGSFGLLFYAVMRDGIVAGVEWRIARVTRDPSSVLPGSFRRNPHTMDLR